MIYADVPNIAVKANDLTLIKKEVSTTFLDRVARVQGSFNSLHQAILAAPALLKSSTPATHSHSVVCGKGNCLKKWVSNSLTGNDDIRD
jgi:hypothetical protein